VFALVLVAIQLSNLDLHRGTALPTPLTIRERKRPVQHCLLCGPHSGIEHARPAQVSGLELWLWGSCKTSASRRVCQRVSRVQRSAANERHESVRERVRVILRRAPCEYCAVTGLEPKSPSDKPKRNSTDLLPATREAAPLEIFRPAFRLCVVVLQVATVPTVALCFLFAHRPIGEHARRVRTKPRESTLVGARSVSRGLPDEGTILWSCRREARLVHAYAAHCQRKLALHFVLRMPVRR